MLAERSHILVFAYVVFVSALIFGVSAHLSNQARRQIAIESAETFMTSLSAVHSYYSREIVYRALAGGASFDVNYRKYPDRIPFPGTVAVDIGRELEAANPKLRFGLFSDDPFPWNAKRTLDQFERGALREFANGKLDPVLAIVNRDGQSIVRYAVPVHMKKDCVTCHNKPAFNLGKVWNVGELRGARQIAIPLPGPEGFALGFYGLAIIGVLLAGGVGMGLVWPSVRRLKLANEAQRKSYAELEMAESKLRRAQKMEAIGHLTGGVAHDFNNILAIILGHTELLVEDGHKGNGSLTAIARASKRGGELSQRLLSFAQKQTLRPAATGVAAIIDGMQLLFGKAVGAPVELHADVPPDLSAVMVDPGQFENALLNLILNARDAMPDGGDLKIVCKNVTLDEPMTVDDTVLRGKFVEISISDTGLGMAREIQEKAFEPFFTTKPVGQGNGLGLSMAYGFARQSGGLLSLESEPGVGTRVHLLLPATDAPQSGEEIDPMTAATPYSGKTVLLIEDDDDVRRTLASNCAALGYVVSHARDANEARRLLNDGSGFDVIVTDVVLPGGADGIEFAVEVRKDLEQQKFIFMSGYQQHDRRLDATCIYLQKPFRRHQLETAIRAALADA